MLSDDAIALIVRYEPSEGACEHDTVTLVLLVPGDGHYVMTVCEACDSPA